jgi:hypothetical protein
MVVIMGSITAMKILVMGRPAPPPDVNGAGRSLGECGKEGSVYLSFAIGEHVYWCIADFSMFALGRPLPPPPSPSPATVVPATMTIEEMQELLLAQEEELTLREEALIAREEKARISEKALARVSSTLDMEWAKPKATW